MPSMTMERASGHSCAGLPAALRACVAIQPMSPCRPASRNSASRCAGCRRSARASSRARRRSRARAPRGADRVLERRSHHACAAVRNRGRRSARTAARRATRSASMRAERAPRLEARVPDLGDGKLLPWHFAQIVDRRQMRGGGKIGERQIFARQPAPAVRQIADIAHMVAQVGADGAQEVDVGRAAAAGCRRA